MCHSNTEQCWDGFLDTFFSLPSFRCVVQESGSGGPAVCVQGHHHKGQPKEDGPTPVQGLLAALPRQPQRPLGRRLALV